MVDPPASAGGSFFADEPDGCRGMTEAMSTKEFCQMILQDPWLWRLQATGAQIEPGPLLRSAA